MVTCEFSGEKCDDLIKVEIAGAVMNVSRKYAHLGKVISQKSKPVPIITKTTTYKKKEKEEVVVIENPQRILQSYMSKNNLTLKHIAHNANVKEGTLQKMMLNKIPFDLKTTQDIEKRFMEIVKRLKLAYDICCSSGELSNEEKDYVHFYLAIRSILHKLTKYQSIVLSAP